MTIRIDPETKGGTTILRVAGRLEGKGASELEALVRQTTGEVQLDVASLVGASDEGLAALRRLAAAGATLRGLQRYLAIRLHRREKDPE